MINRQVAYFFIGPPCTYFTVLLLLS